MRRASLHDAASSDSSQGSVIADAWDLLSRSASYFYEALVPAPAPAPPRKIKQVPDAVFAEFQQHLADHQVASLPYCPRQFYTERGERYVVSRAVAFGTFGHVHIGVRSSDGRQIALKAIPLQGFWQPSTGPKDRNPHHRLNADGTDKIPQTKMPMQLEHVEIELKLALKAGDAPLDAFIHDGRVYIASNLMAGDAFELAFAVLKQGEAWQRADLALSLMDAVAQQMTGVHARGVVHRDLKLENILRSASGHWQVTDWGWAKELAPNACMVGAQGGTVGAIPLEALHGRATNHTFDVFSLGVMVVTAALGRRIFDVGNARDSAMDLSMFEFWLKSVRRANGEIDTRKLRPAMRDVAAFCARFIDAATRVRAAYMGEALAALDTQRATLLRGLTMFDAYFPAERSPVDRARRTGCV